MDPFYGSLLGPPLDSQVQGLGVYGLGLRVKGIGLRGVGVFRAEGLHFVGFKFISDGLGFGHV